MPDLLDQLVCILKVLITPVVLLNSKRYRPSPGTWSCTELPFLFAIMSNIIFECGSIWLAKMYP